LQPPAVQAVVAEVERTPVTELASVLDGFQWTFEKVRARASCASAAAASGGGSGPGARARRA